MTDREYFEQKCNEAAARMREVVPDLARQKGYQDIRPENVCVPMELKGVAALLIDNEADAKRFYNGSLEFNRKFEASRGDYDAVEDSITALEFGLRHAFEQRLRMWQQVIGTEGTPYFKAMDAGALIASIEWWGGGRKAA